MSQSKPTPESRKLLRLAVPVIFSSVGNMLMGLVDTMVVGQYSSLDLAGVAAGNSIFWTIAMIGLGFLAGMDPIVSQAHGAKEPETAIRCLAVALQQAFLYVLMATPIILICTHYLGLSGATADVVTAAQPFLKTLSYGLLPLLLFQVLQRYWQGMEVALPFTLIILVSNVLNYVLALALVQGKFGFPAMGAEGAGWATFIVRIFCLLCGILMTFRLWKQRPELRPRPGLLNKLLKSWQAEAHKKLFKLGLPASAQMALEVCAFSLTTLLIARLGAQSLATHQIVLNIASFAFMFPLGLSAATATRVGYHIGRKDRPQALRSGYLGIYIGASIMGSSAVLLFTIPEPLLRLFTQDLAVIELGVSIIFLCALFQIFDGIQVVAAGVLRGLGDTKMALYANLVAHWFIGLPIGLSLCFWMDKGLWGLWVGLALGLCLTAVFNTYAIVRKSAA